MSPTDDRRDPRRRHAYCPYYCEENVWQLARELGPEQSAVIVVCNRSGQFAMCCQRVAPAPGQVVIWDYHVILVRARDGALSVFDLDSTLPWGVGLETYLEKSFGELSPCWPRLAPTFRVCSAEVYVRRFASDRSHMRDSKGGWRQPPPPWPEISPPHEPPNLRRWLDLDDDFVGECCGLDALVRVVGRQCA